MIECVIYRCRKQSEMYLYLRADLQPDTLPPTLLARLGDLTEVMALRLEPARRLARVDTATVLQQLAGPGYYLQMPPNGVVDAALYFGD